MTRISKIQIKYEGYKIFAVLEYFLAQTNFLRIFTRQTFFIRLFPANIYQQQNTHGYLTTPFSSALNYFALTALNKLNYFALNQIVLNTLNYFALNTINHFALTVFSQSRSPGSTTLRSTKLL